MSLELRWMNHRGEVDAEPLAEFMSPGISRLNLPTPIDKGLQIGQQGCRMLLRTQGNYFARYASALGMGVDNRASRAACDAKPLAELASPRTRPTNPNPDGLQLATKLA